MEDSWHRSAAAALATIGLAGSAAYYMMTGEPDGYRIDTSLLRKQSVPVDGIPACRKSLFSVFGDDWTLGDPMPEASTNTLYDAFLHGLKVNGQNPFLGWRSSSKTGYDNWLTYSEVLEKSTHVGNGLRWLGEPARNDTFVGIFSKNRHEFVLTQLACWQHSMVVVPLYNTLGDEGIEHIINLTKMRVVICEDENMIKSLLKMGKKTLPHLTTIVHIESLSADTNQLVHDQAWKCFPYSQIEKEGRLNSCEQNICKADDLALVCFTSGTTGLPKGAKLQHKNVHTIAMDIISQIELTVARDFWAYGGEVYLSYLPMAHMYEQLVTVIVSYLGGKIGYYSGDVKELFNDIQHLKPTFFSSVPRLLTRIYDKVTNAVSQSKIKSWLFYKGLAEKEKYYRRGIIAKNTIWDKLVFKKVRDLLGGRVKIITTGAAPISPPVLRFYRMAFGAVMLEGYGQTESGSAMNITFPAEFNDSVVGPPLPCTLVKLVDVPEMNYFAANNCGEVCCYGVNNFQGYLHDENKTREAIDEEGWLHSGDIGTWTEAGTLKIIDRKKNIFKLSQGEYVAPEKIENIYVTNQLVAQCFIYGNSLKASVVAIIVPDAEVLPGFCKSKLGLDTADMKLLCQNEKVKKAVLESITSTGKDAGLKGFEQVRDIYLSSEPFTIDNNILTPTLKLKRHECYQAYKSVIDNMSNKLE